MINLCTLGSVPNLNDSNQVYVRMYQSSSCCCIFKGAVQVFFYKIGSTELRYTVDLFGVTDRSKEKKKYA